MLARVGMRSFVVRVVTPPHETLETDGVARGDIVRTRLAHSHVAVLEEVLGGRARKNVLLGVAQLSNATALANLRERPVEAPEHGRDPRASHLRHHELELREPLEHTREQQLHEWPL